jgi:phosphohistidine swiveling domain-containing protein
MTPSPSTQPTDPLNGDCDPAAWWTTTNLGEVLPGILTPMTWSFSGPGLERGMRRAFHAIGGLPGPEAELPADTREWGLGIFFGRTAVSVDFVGRVADRLPGTSGAAMAEQWFGAIPEGFESSPRRNRYPIVMAKLPVVAMLASGRVHELLEVSRPWWAAETQTALTASLPVAARQLANAKQAYENCYAKHIAAQMAGVQPMFELVQKLAEDAGEPELADKLLAGYGSHAETEVVDGIWRVSRGELQLDAFLAEHGCHAPVQGELASHAWREDPRPLRALISNYGEMSDDDSPARGDARRAAEREEAKRRLLAKLPRSSRLGATLTLRLAARQIPLRGVGKVAAARAIDVGRAAARRIGEHLTESGALAAPDDIFFLTVEEAVSASPAESLTDLVAERRETRASYEHTVLPISWRGKPDVLESSELEEAGAGFVLHGTGACSGVVEGHVRVLHDPTFQDVEPGEILVAPFTDPGWASVMFVSSALVVDIGGVQSHAAVVARELGVPCVMGTGDGTQRLRTGDRCRVDGAAGTVEVLETASELQPSTTTEESQ